MLLEHKLNDLKDATMDTTEEKQILAAHTEYMNVKEFAEWIQMLGGVRNDG